MKRKDLRKRNFKKEIEPNISKGGGCFDKPDRSLQCYGGFGRNNGVQHHYHYHQVFCTEV